MGKESSLSINYATTGSRGSKKANKIEKIKEKYKNKNKSPK